MSDRETSNDCRPSREATERSNSSRGHRKKNVVNEAIQFYLAAKNGTVREDEKNDAASAALATDPAIVAATTDPSLTPNRMQGLIRTKTTPQLYLDEEGNYQSLPIRAQPNPPCSSLSVEGSCSDSTDDDDEVEYDQAQAPAPAPAPRGPTKFFQSFECRRYERSKSDEKNRRVPPELVKDRRQYPSYAPTSGGNNYRQIPVGNEQDPAIPAPEEMNESIVSSEGWHPDEEHLRFLEEIDNDYIASTIGGHHCGQTSVENDQDPAIPA